MQITPRLVAAAILIAVASGAGAAESHSHQGHAPQGLEQLTLNGTARWKTDAPLRKGMDGIRHDLDGALGAIHHGTLDGAGYATLARRLQGHVDYMVGNCRLPAEVDAQAHLVLEQIIDGIKQMEGANDRADGAVKIATALDAYGRFFDHSGWKTLKH